MVAVHNIVHKLKYFWAMNRVAKRDDAQPQRYIDGMQIRVYFVVLYCCFRRWRDGDVVVMGMALAPQVDMFSIHFCVVVAAVKWP